MPRRAPLARLVLALLAAVALLVGLMGPTVGPAAAKKKVRSSADALHSLRAPVTDENFYFVMADRFENGDPANDRGLLAGDEMTHGFAPEKRGFYHGGDLKGLLSRIDYIQGLGTDSSG